MIRVSFYGEYQDQSQWCIAVEGATEALKQSECWETVTLRDYDNDRYVMLGRFENGTIRPLAEGKLSELEKRSKAGVNS